MLRDELIDYDCDQHYIDIYNKYTQRLDCGMYGCVFADPNDLRYVAKFGRVGIKNSAKDEIIREYEINKLMAEYEVAPHVYELHFCNDKYYVIVMDRLDMTLEKYSKKYSVSKEIFNRLEDKVIQLERLGYIHNDLHPGNIMLEFNIPGEPESGIVDVFLIDFGKTKLYKRDYMDKCTQDIRKRLNITEKGLTPVELWEALSKYLKFKKLEWLDKYPEERNMLNPIGEEARQDPDRIFLVELLDEFDKIETCIYFSDMMALLEFADNLGLDKY